MAGRAALIDVRGFFHNPSECGGAFSHDIRAKRAVVTDTALADTATYSEAPYINSSRKLIQLFRRNGHRTNFRLPSSHQRQLA